MDGRNRNHPPIKIYQDPEVGSPPFQPLNQRARPHLQPSAIPRQPVLGQRCPLDVAINAPVYPQGNLMSPQKMAHFQQPMLNFDHMGMIDIPAPQMAPVYDTSPVKRMVGPVQPQLFGPPLTAPNAINFDTHFENFDQENMDAVAANDNADFPSPSYNRRGLLKRSMSDIPPMYDRGNKRPRVEEPKAPVPIPEPEDMLPVEDEPSGNKPSHSYAQMIGMAILRAKGRKLTLAQIYEWISSTFAFYNCEKKTGWHNSIRHNLSLNKNFTKTERPKGDPGKGCYWVIVPGNEFLFMKDKGRKASNNNSLSNINVHTNVMHSEPISLSQPAPSMDVFDPNPFVQETFVLEPRPQTAPAIPDISSDATVPASDPALNEEQEQALVDAVNIVQQQTSSPDGLNSSPPVVTNIHRRAGSSPSARRQQPPFPSHKRTATTMNVNDSGYWSSLESSVLRPRQQQLALTSDLDLESSTKKKRKFGRAEHAIVRMRGSSQDQSSPTLRNTSVNPFLEPNPSSPPQTSPNLQPATPGVFKKPARPVPDSVSPNTQLANHRQEMGQFLESPTPELLPHNSIDQFPDTSPLKFSGTPGIALNHSPFNIFLDDSISHFTPSMTPGYGQSPLKAARRAPLTRSLTGSSNKLRDILNSANANREKGIQHDNTPSKLGPWTTMSSADAFTGSPIKGNAILYQDENVLGDYLNFGDDADPNYEGGFGLDLGPGFTHIGTDHVNPTNLSKARPGLGPRSNTNHF